MDLELLISVTGGLGSWQQDEDGIARYCTTADTLGANARAACFSRPAPRRGWRLGALSGRARRLPQGLAALPAARRPGQAGGLLCAGPVRGRPFRPRGHHHNLPGGLRACLQRACAPTACVSLSPARLHRTAHRAEAQALAAPRSEGGHFPDAAAGAGDREPRPAGMLLGRSPAHTEPVLRQPSLAVPRSKAAVRLVHTRSAHERLLPEARPSCAGLTRARRRGRWSTWRP